MNRQTTIAKRLVAGLALALAAAAAQANAVVPGITGPTFDLTTGSASLSTPDGDSILIWAYGNGTNAVQLPGPTLIVNQGDTVTVNLTNQLAQRVSIVFPGQGQVTASGGAPGLLTREACSPEDTAPCGGSNTVSYAFTAAQPGTYVYHSGTNTELQVEMGLYGAIIVRPAGFDQSDPAKRTAYGHAGTAYDHEYLFLLSEMDPFIHDLVDFGFPELIDNTTAFPVFWFINGRNGVDTLSPDNVGWHPNQPYGALARTRPGEKVLLRLVNLGRNQHAFHPHGAHSLIVARDGRMLESAPGAGPDLGVADFTITPTPGGTIDAIFRWTSKGLGWDIYGDPNEAGFAHACTGAGPDNIDPATGEDCAYHGVRLDSKVVLPGLQDVSFGGWYSGSPFLGHFGQLPPGEGGLNLNGGLFFMWHSHNEKELTNFDIFPGGMLTFVIIEPPGTPIP
ncbi:signal peptide protein [Sulfurifustis variabilis]|uniref:Signal peptide protein n=1 Tax=Sulfurifustis variabilis TaxID=1675686 RepID=A0A1B4VD10_9GAMM|nr:multicopper oxidase domain-containing protein [Sulfurifustis variabilis]BAU50051.1 signal peptide protein [Sulfurifustis variabilis]